MNEIKVNRPPKIHDLDKPGINSEDIQIGDILQFTLPGSKRPPVQQRVLENGKDLIKSIDLIDGLEKPEAYDYWSKSAIETNYARSHINEITRLQQLAGINEIKVNNPTNIKPENMILGKKYLITYCYEDESIINKKELTFKPKIAGTLYDYKFHTNLSEYDYVFLDKDEIIKVNQI